MNLLEELAGKVETGKNRDVQKICLKALEEGFTTEEILNEGLLKGMNAASEKYRNGDILITHILMAAGAMTTGTKVLQLNYPDLSEDADDESSPRGKVIIGTISGDLHDIGKNMVKLMMESRGIEVIDLGVNVNPADFVQEALSQNAKVIACSALLTTAMPMLAKVVEEAEKRGVRKQLKIMVGGAPVTREFTERIGADAYTDNAAEATETALTFLEE